MDVPTPSSQQANLSPDRPSVMPLGQETRMTLDSGSGANVISGVIYERPERMNAGVHGEFSSTFSERSHLDSAQAYLPVSGAATCTIAYKGPKIPFTLKALVSDSSTTPATETVTDYAMGPSNTSQNITLGATETLESLRAIRRF